MKSKKSSQIGASWLASFTEKELKVPLTMLSSEVFNARILLSALKSQDATRRTCTTLMSSHFYEVALFGEFFAQDLKPVVNRITLHSESAQPMHCREVVFEPIDAQIQRENNTEPVLLRARKEVLDPNSKW
jgi:hypothetical protein